MEGMHEVARPGTMARLPRARIRRFEGQPRKFFDPEKLEELAGSLETEGQKLPIEVRVVTGDPDHDYELIDGERRWLAANVAGIATLLAFVVEVESDEQQFIDSVVANFGREGHTPLETAHALTRVMASSKLAGLGRTAQIERAAKMFARSTAWVYTHLNLLNLHPEVQKMLEPDAPEGQRLGFSVAMYLNNVRDQGLQLEVAKQLVGKQLRVNQARHLIRKLIGTAGAEVKHRPSDHFRVLESFLERIAADAERVLDMPFREFGAVLARRSANERAKMLARIDGSIAQLQEIRAALSKVIAAEKP